MSTLVDQGFLHGVGVGGDLVQQRDPNGVLVRQRGHNDHRDHQPQNVNGQAPLAARYFFAASRPVDPAGTPAAACTLWVSSTTRLGSAFRRAISRTCQRSRS
ncbi:hypothetical protein QFZ22_000095 [Streptomyces canus]|uniref:Uncharacterized protein n=1 Tax=Streptomyces canus TaxID=58343 RepID=A0AAW8F425_9ACTN|nr:hypothetical protein [Streptomyces canus]